MRGEGEGWRNKQIKISHAQDTNHNTNKCKIICHEHELGLIIRMKRGAKGIRGGGRRGGKHAPSPQDDYEFLHSYI